MKPIMKKLAAIFALILLLTACAAVPPEETTAAPTTIPATVPADTPTTAPATVPTTAPTEPTTAPTEPPITELIPSMWMIEPEYPTYEALFSQNLPYADYCFDWVVEQDGVYREYRIDSSEEGILVSSYDLDADYLVPNTKDFRGEENDYPQFMGCDGKYAYFYNMRDTNRIFQMELLTGEVRIIVEEERIYGYPTLVGGFVVYYVRPAGDKGEVCRLYIPEGRVDVLCEMEKPEHLFNITYPATSQGKIRWHGLNPQIMERAIKEWENPESTYKRWAPVTHPDTTPETIDFSDMWDTWNNGEFIIDDMHRDQIEFFFYFFERDTGILALEQTAFDPAAGTYNKKLGTLDNCWLGSGFPHDHFNPVYEPLPVPQAIMGPWQELPGLEIQGTPSAAKEDPFVRSYRVPGSANRQLFLQEDGKLTLLLDKAWTPIKSTETAVYCLTDENSIVELSYDGSVCNTLYAADNGTLTNFVYSGGMLCFREDSRVLLLDIAAKQYRVLMDDPEVYIELWFEGSPSFCFSLSKGLYYQQYLFDINTGAIEETFIL